MKKKLTHIKKIKRLWIYIGFIVFLYGCQDVIDVDLPEAETRLVVEASYNYTDNNQTNSYLMLSLTSNYFNDVIELVNDAEVKIMDITHNVSYTLVNENNNGVYHSSNFFLKFNTDYKLQIIYKDEVYESTIERLIPTVQIDKLEQGDGVLFEGDEKELIITFTDDASRNDYYLFQFASNLYLTTEDEFYQGNQFTFSYFLPDVAAGEEIHVNIFGIDERYFNYMTTIIEQTEDRGNPFGTAAVNARGNIKNLTNPDNYPLGYFRLSEMHTRSIIIK